MMETYRLITRKPPETNRASLTEQLLTALKDRDLNGFRNLLCSPSATPDHFYDAPDYGTCLYIAASKGLTKFGKFLIDATADVNGYNKIRKNTPLHVACAEGHPEMVRLLLSFQATPSTLDIFGRQPIHWAAIGGGNEYTEKHIECLKILLDSGSSINTSDRTSATALHLALLQNHKNAAKILLDNGANPDVASGSEKTVRDLIQERMPDAFDKLLPTEVYKRAEEDSVETLLFRYEYNKKLNEFKQQLQVAVNKGVDIGKIHDGNFTLLQYASDNEGLEEFITVLLNIPTVDPNGTCPGTTQNPILLAAYHGNHKALRLLVDNDKTDITVRDEIRETALHKVARMERVRKDDKNYLKSFEILIEAIKSQGNFKDFLPHKRLNVNAIDGLGNIALHYAAQNLDDGSKQAEKMVSVLLREVSSVFIQNKMGELAISKVKPSLLEDYLDECVGTNEESPCKEGYELTFDYTMLIPPYQISTECTQKTEDAEECPDTFKETELLRYLCQVNEFQRLLKHPLITSFLYLKWHRIRWIFYGNLTFYILLVAFLTSYILGVYGTDPPDEGADDSASMGWTGVCSIISVILLAILGIRELFQFIMLPLEYIKNLENMLEVVLIIMAAIMLFSNFKHHVKQNFAALVILSLWIELVLLIGKHRNFSTYITMFITVSLNYLTFLLYYSLFIVAFALSFFVLLRQGEHKEEIPVKEGGAVKEEKNSSADPGRAILKLFTGEFEYSNLPLDIFHITSHIVFLLFLFFIVLVLFNLLNGLAVSDTQALIDKAELGLPLSRATLVSYAEDMLLGKCFQFLNKLSQCFCKKKTVTHTILPTVDCEARRGLPKADSGTRGGLAESILLLPDLNTVKILVNKRGKIEPRCCSTKKESSCFMDRSVIQEATNIVGKRAKRKEKDKKKHSLQTIENMIKQISDNMSKGRVVEGGAVETPGNV